MTLSITCRCFGGLPGDKDCSVKHLGSTDLRGYCRSKFVLLSRILPSLTHLLTKSHRFSVSINARIRGQRQIIGSRGSKLVKEWIGLPKLRMFGHVDCGRGEQLSHLRSQRPPNLPVKRSNYSLCHTTRQSATLEESNRDDPIFRFTSS